MIRPQSLKKGDTIGITAPGRKLNSDILDASVKIMESWGFQVRVGKNVYSGAHSYLSGSDEERLADLQVILDDQSIHAIICARGGYGITRILDQLDFTTFIKKPKWICGFSDITALHVTLHKLGVQSIHSTMPVLFPQVESASSIESLRKLLMGEAAQLAASSHPKNKSGEATGQMIGGNLSLLADSLGTCSEIDTENKILMIEEIGEYIYKVDRMLVHLKRAGKLNNLAGLVVGYMTDINETELPFGESFYDLILNHVKGNTYPLGFNFPTGHENPNIAWIQGAIGQLNVTQEKSTLTF